MKKYLAHNFIVACVILLCLQVGAQANAGPSEQLKPTLDKLVAILTDPNLKGDAKKIDRRRKIMSTIKERFDFGEMSKRVLGSTWRKIDDRQKVYFTELMTKLIENNYVGQLENYSGQKVEFVGERIKKNRAQVSTLIENNGAKLPVHYIMSKDNANWMVYDINIEGVSLVRNYRAEFNSILKREEFEGLVSVLEKKNKSFE